MAKMGKKYAESIKLIDKNALYTPSEAIDLTLKTAKAKFDETIELSIRLGVDPRHADQQVRGAVVLPHGTGKKVDRKSTRLNSSHANISYAVFCLKKKKIYTNFV